MIPYFPAPEICALLAVFLAMQMYRHIMWRKGNPHGLPLPPGPPGQFLIGNLKDMPVKDPWLTYTEWSKKYGAIFLTTVWGRRIIYINSQEAATELFERRSLIYSDRPHMPMLADLMGWIWSAAFQGYGEPWRRQRKLFHQGLQSEAARAYLPIQRQTTFRLLANLLNSPHDFPEHMKQLSGETVLQVLYGYKSRPKNDYFINLSDQVNIGILQGATAGKFLVDFIPMLKYVPEWFPGASFQRKARKWKDQGYEMRDKTFEIVKRDMASGEYPHSFCSELLDRLKDKEDRSEWEKDIGAAAGGLYAAGQETTAAALMTFILVMLQNPDVQRRAQDEIETVIGPTRLPEFIDRDDLPYVDAIVRELYRWHPVASLGIPHRVMEDDFYNGYWIPKGTIIVGNPWAILHDEETYPEPLKFKPERWINTAIGEKSSTGTVVFGFGRRICPGRYLADSSVWYAVACMLATFDVRHAKSAGGENIEPVAKWTNGLACHPEPFPCSITVRNERARSLIQEVCQG